MSRPLRIDLGQSVFNGNAVSGAKSTSSLLLKDLLTFASTPQGALSFVLANDARSGGGIDLDFYWTIIRLHQVFSNVLLNNTNSDSGNIHYGDNALGWSLVGGGAVIGGIGLGRAVYQRVHNQYLKSDAYYLERLSKMAPGQLDSVESKKTLADKVAARVKTFAGTSPAAPSKDESEKRLNVAIFDNLTLSTPNLVDELIKGLDDGLLSLFVTDVDLKTESGRKKLEQRILNLIALFRAYQISEELKEIQKKKALDLTKVVENFDEAEKNLSADLKTAPLPSFVQVLNLIRNSGFIGAMRTLWDWANTYSYIYWLAVMPVMIIAGMTAALESLGVVVTTLVLGSVFAIWNGVRWGLQKAGVMAPEKTAEEKAVDKEEERQHHEAKLRHLALATHDVVMGKIYGAEEWAKRKMALQAQKNKTLTKQAPLASGMRYLLDQKLRAVKANEALVESFTGSKREQRLRMVVAVLSVISTSVNFVFLMFLVTSTMGVVLGPLFATLGWAAGGEWLVAAAAYLGNSMGGAIITAGIGTFLGAVGSLFDYSKMYTEQADCEKKVNAILSAEYKNTGKSNMEVYSGLKDSIKLKILALKNRIGLTENDLKVINEIEHSINTKAQEGVRYFEKFQVFTPIFSKLKKVWDGMYDFLTQAQTGVFCARNFFLASGVATAVMGGIAVATGGTALIPFIITAVILGIFVGCVGVTKAMLERRQKHREETIESLPAQIKTYKKWEQQLVAIDQVHKMPGTKPLTVSGADQPVVEQKSLDKGAQFNPKNRGLGLDLPVSVAVERAPVPFSTLAKVSKLSALALPAPESATGTNGALKSRRRSVSFSQ